MTRYQSGRWLPLLLLLILLFSFFGAGLNKYLSFAVLKEHRNWLVLWVQSHYITALLCFMGSYTIAVAVSIPGAAFLTIIGGFLFGPYVGTLAVVISATLGATILYFAVLSALREWLMQRASGWVVRLQKGFSRNAFSYLLTLRLIPLFPFWVVNIVPALLHVKPKVFISATFPGIIPGSLVYVLLGNGLNQIFAVNKTPNLGIIFEPKILIALLALAALSLGPVVYQIFYPKGDKQEGRNNL